MSATYGDSAREALRAIVARIEHEIPELPNTGLRASWNELVQALALGPAPETRVCPACGGVGMSAASRCGQCWAALERLPRVVSDAMPRKDT